MPILCGCPASTKQIILPSSHRNTCLPTSRDCILNSQRHGTISREPSKENSAALQGFSSPCSPYIEECFILPVLLLGSVTRSLAYSQVWFQAWSLAHSQVWFQAWSLAYSQVWFQAWSQLFSYILPYSRKHWRSLNLAVWSWAAEIKILADLNLAVVPYI